MLRLALSIIPELDYAEKHELLKTLKAAIVEEDGYASNVFSKTHDLLANSGLPASGLIFHEISEKCYMWQQKQPGVKEESLTDWLLYATSQATDRFYYRAFSRNREAHNGADWEWWVLTDGDSGLCAYRFLVQAKKLRSGQDNFPLISYGNRNGLQIDLLIESAKQRNAMPIYMYYSTEEPDIKQQLKNFSFIAKDIVEWCKGCTNGVYMSMAQGVKDRTFNSPRKEICGVDLLNHSLKFSMCDLLFDKGFGNRYPAKVIMDAVNNYYIDYMHGKDPSYSGSIKHPKNKMPPYLATLIRCHNQDNLGWYESEFERHLNGLAGVAVVDLSVDCRFECPKSSELA